MEQSDTVVAVQPEDLFVELREQATVERLASGLLADFLEADSDAPHDTAAAFDNEHPINAG